MCYFLYGAINDSVNKQEYEKVMKNSEFHFNFGDITDVNACVKHCEEKYRITFHSCDCDTAIGQKHTNKKQLKSLQALLLSLKEVQGIKYLLLSKNWWKEKNTEQETVHIDDINILYFLANMEENCLYKIELYKKYY